MGISRRQFQVGSGDALAALMGDLSVDAAHRSALPAMTLLRAAIRHVAAHFAFAYAFPNQKAVAVLRRAGFGLLGHARRYVRLLRHAPYVRRVAGLPGVGLVAGAALDGAAALHERLRSRRAGPGCLVWFDEARPVDGRFDQLWAEARQEYGIVARRSSAFLGWRFLDNPAARHRIVALERGGPGGPLDAYAVIETLGDVAHVRDLFGRSASFDGLLARLLPALSSEGATSVSLRCLAPRLTPILTRHEFRLRPNEERSVVIAASPGAPAGWFSGPERFYLTDGDEDI
jgi:hypothetical protein